MVQALRASNFAPNSTEQLEAMASNWSYNFEMDMSTGSPFDVPHIIYLLVNRVTLPLLGMLGTLGNLASIVIFTRRFRKRTVNGTERGALLGFVAIATSDLCFCVGLVPRMGLQPIPSVVYESRSEFSLYYQMYHHYAHDVFIKISTWLATVVSVSRYVSVAKPLQVHNKNQHTFCW